MYQAGIYCRISIEELEKNGEYSNSIHSQLQMAEDYIEEHSDIQKSKVYIDEGVSGSHFNRPQFRRMLADIELGTINMIILKDVSRLGREHIDTNYYLGKYFPERNIRVISILDNYDSARNTYDELLEIKTLLNDMYLRDTSRKIKAAIKTKRSNGEYTYSEPPFGYRKSDIQRNHLEIDPYAADIVRQIYQLYLAGKGSRAIATILNQAAIPAPARYKKEVLKKEYPWNTGKGLWTASTVISILKNPIYTGTIVIHKFDKPSYKLKYRKLIPFQELELSENAHEPIISKEDFKRVQILRDANYAPYFDKNNEPHKYVGILYCGNCKTAMKKRYLSSRQNFDGYVCGFHQKMGKVYCSLNHISFEKLDELVAYAINEQIKQIKSELLAARLTYSKGKKDVSSTIIHLEADLSKKRQYLKKAYEEFMDEFLSKDEYLELKRMYEQEIQQIQLTITQMKETEHQKEQNITALTSWLDQFSQEEITARHLTREFLTELINKIYIYPDQKIDICFTFSNPANSAEKGNQNVSNGSLLPFIER